MGTTQHDNAFTFSIDGLTEVSFDLVDHKISHSQESTWGGVSVKGNTIHILAGREKSVHVANWFNDAASGIALTYGDKEPEELNFGVQGTLRLVIYGITYTAENFYLAQGSASAGDNNWWVGSPQMSNMTQANVDDNYATDVAKTALSYVAGMISENPIGSITSTANLIVEALKKHYVGSGEIPFTMSTANNTVELLLFQMPENHETTIQLTGNYCAP